MEEMASEGGNEEEEYVQLPATVNYLSMSKYLIYDDSPCRATDGEVGLLHRGADIPGRHRE